MKYASQEAREWLAQHGWVASMSRTGNSSDTIWMESASRKIKNEVLGRYVPADPAVAVRFVTTLAARL